MNVERIVIERLHHDGVGRAPDGLLKTTIDKVAATPQVRLLWPRRRPAAERTRPNRPLYAVAAVLVGISLLGALAVFGGANDRIPAGVPGALAYAQDGDIFVADSDGRDAVRIADGSPVAVMTGSRDCAEPRGYSDPSWSPDGRYLAYRGLLDQNCADPARVYISDRSGNVLGSFSSYGWSLPWSPDSASIVTWDVSAGFGEEALAIYRLDGTIDVRLPFPSGFGPGKDEDPAWSPDGASVLISLRGPDLAANPRQMWELPTDGGSPRVVPSKDPRAHRDVAYSADGTRVAYVDEQLSLRVVANADGSQARSLAADTLLDGSNCPSRLALSPAGDRIAFVAAVGTKCELRVQDVSTGLTTPLMSVEGPEIEVNEFSADGSMVYFSGGPNNHWSAWSVEIDGRHPQMLVTEATGDWHIGVPASSGH